MVRDVALAAVGPAEPEDRRAERLPAAARGRLERARTASMKWETSTGEDRHRRSLYTFCRRSSPYPSLVTFDAPSREQCTARRVRTNTPLQALTTLNDPVFVEAARALARADGERRAGATPRGRIAHGYRLCTAAAPVAAPTSRRSWRSTSARRPLRASRAAALLAGTPEPSADAPRSRWWRTCS